jgi:hypothetical protein
VCVCATYSLLNETSGTWSVVVKELRVYIYTLSSELNKNLRISAYIYIW